MNQNPIDNRIMEIIQECERLSKIINPLYDSLIRKILEHDFLAFFSEKGIELFKDTTKYDYEGYEFNIAYGHSIDIKRNQTGMNMTFILDVITEIYSGYIAHDDDMQIYFSEEYWGLSKYKTNEIEKVVELGKGMLERKKESIMYLNENQEVDRYDYLYYNHDDNKAKFKTLNDIFKYVLNYK